MGSLAADDPFNGDWRLSASKTKNPTNGPVTQAIHIECDEKKVALVFTGTTSAGQPMRWTVKADFSGNPTGVLDSPELDTVRCWRADPRNILVELFRGAKSIGYWKAELAKNGKTLKVTSTSFDASGKEVNTVDTFERP